MILENSKNQKKEVQVLLTIEENKKKYYIYSVGNEFLHVGIKKKNKLEPIDDKEFEKVNDILTKLNMINSKVV